MKDLLTFIASIADELLELFAMSQATEAPDPEAEKDLAMRLIRKASDERARREIEAAGGQ